MARVACLLLLGGCINAQAHTETVWRTTASITRDSDGTRGADFTASYGSHGFHGFAGLFGEGLYRHTTGDPGRRTGAGFELGFRGSPVAVFADDHTFEHWVDFGWEFGFGPGVAHTSRYELLGMMWGGGWLELAPGRSTWYPAVFLDVRYQAYSAPFDSAVVYSIGLSFVRRHPTEGWMAP